MIEKIIVNSRTTEIHGTTRTINTSYQQSGLTEDVTLAEIFTRLVTANDKLGVAIDRSKVESILADKDDVRDEAVRAVGYLVQGYLYSPREAVREAAATVKKVFDKYGFAVTQESYVVESSHISSMLGDLAAPDVLAAIDQLRGLDENIANLQAAEDDFENTRAQFAEEEAEESTQPSATTLKKNVVAIINDDLVPFLRYGERFQASTYGNFSATVAQLINDNNEQVKKRTKKIKANRDSL
ncbi:DUF6261 family protein [uncultured Draconibacterium sp.]|uniref:DUF6261 family protein n=1 Tax=uncultured Draconibacterium sp. TaxID=1573823 RepID=UPI0029C6C605|nr:DUF6261 family protein [uncultured Draconibacterium sp.]